MTTVSKKNRTFICVLLTVLYEQIISIKIANDLQVNDMQGENEDPVRESVDGMVW